MTNALIVQKVQDLTSATNTLLTVVSSRKDELSENDGAGMVGFNATNSYLKNTVGGLLNEYVTPTSHPWLAKFDGVSNDGAAISACIDFAKTAGYKVHLPPGTAIIDGYEFILDSPVHIEGQGRSQTKLIFQGVPVKTQRTFAIWRSEYDSGNYSASSDPAIACGFIIKSPYVRLADFTIQTPWDANTNHSLPFNSAIDYPTSNYDHAILVQRSDVQLERLLICGPWGNATNHTSGGIKLDVTQPSGAVEHVKIIDCETYGRWGLVIEGPHGAGSYPSYTDLTSSDIRGSGGISDLTCIGSQFYDTSGNASVRLTINGSSGKRVRRYDSMSGGMFIDGQVALNSAKRQQQITFIRCRFAAVDPYVYLINFCNRVEFIGCHSEYKSGYLLSDGVTVITPSNSLGITTTSNARGIVYIGGEKSGEPDNRTFKDSDNRNLISEIGYDEPVANAPVGAGRMLSGVEFRARGGWTPVLRGSGGDGAPTFTARTGTYVKVGNLVFITARITLSSKGGISGSISIDGLPFTATGIHGSAGDSSVSFGAISGVTFLDGLGGVINDDSKIISLIRNTSAGAVGNITDAHLTDTARFDFSGCYITEDA